MADAIQRNLRHIAVRKAHVVGVEAESGERVRRGGVDSGDVTWRISSNSFAYISLGRFGRSGSSSIRPCAFIKDLENAKIATPAQMPQGRNEIRDIYEADISLTAFIRWVICAEALPHLQSIDMDPCRRVEVAEGWSVGVSRLSDREL